MSNDEKMGFDEFVDHLLVLGKYDCRCSTTETPPCSFCEIGVSELYEEYLNEEEM